MSKMTKRGAAILGGQTTALINRERALALYYENPNRCENCDIIIEVKDHERPSITRKKKFCSRKCAATYNNHKSPKRRSRIGSSGICEKCGQEIQFKHFKSGGYSFRKYCDPCLKKVQKHSAKEAHEKRENSLLPKPLYEMTKGELLEHHRNHKSPYLAFKIRISKDARCVYKESGQAFVCKVCGYSHHTQIAHIKSVEHFSDDTLIREINHIENLAALCPNHHWELDHGLLVLESTTGFEPANLQLEGLTA